METVETSRLLLRPFVPEDRDDYLRVFTKPELGEFPFGRAMTAKEALPGFERRVQAHANGGIVSWAAVIKATNVFIGWIGLSFADEYPEYEDKVQVGWRIDPDAWGHGYATEGGRASVTYAFSNLVSEVFVFAQPENVRSLRVAERLGAREIGHTTANVRGIRDLDHVVLRIERKNWTMG